MYGASQQGGNQQQPSAGTPLPARQGGNDANGGAASDGRSAPPAISLPKGGGAIRGMGEKFAANPVTGTGSLSVPIYTSPGRSGFGPQLSLSYDSGAGNGPFGWGWSLSIPSITRKTDKGLPKYQDSEESDIFILSGAEDLVPALKEVNGQWERDVAPGRIGTEDYDIHRYRPRIEGLFARIERWTRQSDGDTHWRSISGDNITTLYGKTKESRIADPADPSRVFSWLICESYDDKGNAIRYEYKAENTQNIMLSLVQERNRTDTTRAANRYLKRVKYGNETPRQLDEDLSLRDDWLFEVVFDYGEHCTEDDQGQPIAVFVDDSQRQWLGRRDSFSSYRAGFEVRTYRLCRRVLMFHHFPEELGTDDYLVRATEFSYDESPIASFITGVTQSGYVLRSDGTYLKKSLPPLEFGYSKATIQEEVREIDAESLENLPYGLDGTHYQWLDLDGEGTSGILTEQAGAWFYKRNLSPISVEHHNGEETVVARFGPTELVTQKPSLAEENGGRQQFLDLAGDGSLDLVQLGDPVPGFYERTDDARWDTFTSFDSLPELDWGNPNLRFVDLTGDGHADILITEDEVFTWYPSLAEAGFASSKKVRQALDEEERPRLIFADGTQSVYLADLSGDGLTDLVRIRNSAVCYWPNLGYGRFGAKVTMDDAPFFDAPDQFDQRRIRLADIDGSGVTDIIYLGRDGMQLYFNQSGNSWSEVSTLTHLPRIDNLSSVAVTDLLGSGTACLIWSSPLPDAARRPMRYLDLMGGQKPHLLIKSVNNLGAETHVHYAPSTKFYLADKLEGKPWITRIPFPIHVVDRVETYDRISGNRFVTRYVYHHGYFDGVEREFRGFGMVEQFDTEEFAALSASGAFPDATNIDEASHVPPVHTKTWSHTGAYVGRDHVSNFFAGLLDDKDVGEYYREPGLTDAKVRELLLDDTTLPTGLTTEEEREACRALKGSMLRQEVYALDGTDKEQHPYTISEQNFTIRRLQPQAGNRHAVFFTHAREALNYHYERNPADPRVAHALTLEVDAFGNVLKEAAIGYGRRQPDPDLPLQADRDKQTQTLIAYTENRVTNAIEAADDYRTPLPCETRTYELTGYTPTGAAGRFQFSDFVEPDPNEPQSRKLMHIFDSEIEYEDKPTNGKQRRLIEHVRTLYRKNDLSGLLPLGQLESLAVPSESYKLAFTPGLLAHVYKRKLGAEPEENLLPDAAQAQVLGGKGGDQGGYVDLDANGRWWIPSGRLFYSTTANVADPAATAAAELTEARRHFFSPRKFTDPFDHSSTVDYDTHDLLVVKTEDAAHNTVTALHDYRVMQPKQMTDPNGNRSEARFDALGLVVGTVVMGKNGEGDSFATFTADLTPQQIKDYFDVANPRPLAIDHLGTATTRIIYDLERVPACAASVARETHVDELAQDEQTKVQLSFVYSDGFGREAHTKIQAEPGQLDPNDPNSPLLDPLWVGTGAEVYNNKGKPVRQYEPFFSPSHHFGIEQHGVSSTLFYDPAERVVATLHPNHTWEKVVFDPWQQTTYDVNDTVLNADGSTDPKSDEDVKGFFSRLADTDYLPTWYERRIALAANDPERVAADKAAVHRQTPTVAHLDTLGRAFLSIAHNCFERSGAIVEEKYPTRVELDIEGNQRAVRDAGVQNADSLGRIVMRYDYDMLGDRIHQASMEAGERWLLGDVTGKAIRAWDSRGHAFRTESDPLRRPLRSFVTGADLTNPNQELLTERLIYGEQHPQDELRNLRGELYLHLDQAGVATNEAHDFKGNLLRASRRLEREYKRAVDWSVVDAALPANSTTKLDAAALEAALAPRLEADTFNSRTAYDALNRPTEMTAPDDSVLRPTYNEANLLERVDVNLRGGALATPFVADVDYNAKGQRMLIDYGNGVRTTYEHDPLTFRPSHLETRRGAEVLQDLHYTYDPVGNITLIRDGAQQTTFFRNKRVEPSAEYTYDAIYRLIEATGREHLGQTGGQFNPPTAPDAFNRFHTRLDHPGNGDAMGTYVEHYFYDAVGNILSMQHRGSDPSHSGWTRNYAYDEESLLEPFKTSNRLSRTTIGMQNGQPVVEPYSYDAHGNMTTMPHLSLMQWDYLDQLQATAQQVVNNGTPETTYYVYDASGQRARKVTERQASAGQTPTRKEERIYLGGLEIYREYENDGDTVKLERETLRVMDNTGRIALVETRTHGSDPAPEQLIRYQFGNHLGSASLEVDDQAQIISYEEYYPYGSTSYQAVRSQAETPKRYRYTGMERDEESGLAYHSARYYAPWLGRWMSCDPLGTRAGVNAYTYCDDSPVRYLDPSGLDSDINQLSDEQLLEVSQQNPINVESNALHEFDELFTAEKNGFIDLTEPADFERMLTYQLAQDPTAYNEFWTLEKRLEYAEATDQTTMAESQWAEFVNQEYMSYLQRKAEDWALSARLMEGWGKIGKGIGWGVVGAVGLFGAATVAAPASLLGGGSASTALGGGATTAIGAGGATTTAGTGTGVLATAEYTAVQVIQTATTSSGAYLTASFAYGAVMPPGSPDFPGPGDDAGRLARGAVAAADEAFIGTERIIAGYDVIGKAELIGSRYSYTITGWFERPGESQGLRAFLNALKGEASAAGAKEIEIIGGMIENRILAKMNPKLWEKFGFTLEKLSDTWFRLRASL